MSQAESQELGRKGLPTRSVLLILLVVALGAGAVAYGLGSAFAADSAASQNTLLNTSNAGNLSWYGHWGGCQRNGASTSFRAFSSVSNVTVTGFAITSSNQITVNLSYNADGTSPAITITANSPNLSGSTTLTAGWGNPTTATINLSGSGSLSTDRYVAIQVVPYAA